MVLSWLVVFFLLPLRLERDGCRWKSVSASANSGIDTGRSIGVE